jgi:hypothetical protein
MNHVRSDGRVRGHGTRAAPIAAVAELRPALTDVPGACRYLGDIGRSTFYADLMPRLDVVHIGTRTLIIVASLDRLVEELRAEAGVSTGSVIAADREPREGASNTGAAPNVAPCR